MLTIGRVEQLESRALWDACEVATVINSIYVMIQTQAAGPETLLEVARALAQP
jgi:hypothetical protein